MSQETFYVLMSFAAAITVLAAPGAAIITFAGVGIVLYLAQ